MLSRALANYLLKILFYKGQLLFTEENRGRLKADCVVMVWTTSHRTNPRGLPLSEAATAASCHIHTLGLHTRKRKMGSGAMLRNERAVLTL